jgi:hypothetical protein
MESIKPLTEMSTREFPGGKGGWCVRLTTLLPSCAVVMKSGNLNFLEHSGLLQACNGTDLPYTDNQLRLQPFESGHYFRFCMKIKQPWLEERKNAIQNGYIIILHMDIPRTLSIVRISDYTIFFSEA